MDFGKALTYPFEDEEWLQKLGIGLVVGLVPIVNFALGGWQVALISNVKNKVERPLPAWEGFGDYFMKGLLVAVAWFIYSLPTFIFGCVAYAAQFGALAAAGNSNDGGTMATLGTVVLACCGCLALLWIIVAAVTMAGAIIRFADNPVFSTFMEFGTNFGLVRDNLSLFATALLYLIGAGLALGIVSSITLGLGSLVTPIVMTYFSGHLLGQLSTQLSEAGAAM